MKSLRARSFFVLCFALAVPSCKVAATPAEASEHSRDFIRLDPANPKLNYIKVEVAEESAAAPSVHLTGRVTFDEDHTQRIASPIDGRVTKVLVQLGDSVKRDQPVIELSSGRAAELTSDAQKAQQDLSLAEKSLDRATKLKQEGAISDKDVAQVESDFKKAKSDATRSSAQLRNLSLSMSGPSITAGLRSQIAGIVVDRNVLGQEVRADGTAPLLTVTDLGTVWVLADLYEQDLALVTKGASVNVMVPAYPGEPFAGTVAHVGEVLDPSSHTVKLRCLVPNPGNRLKPEMFAKVELSDAGDRKAILLPSRAVLTDSEHSRVIVATEGNVFRQRVVELGPEADGKVRVLAGVKAGEKIVVDGAIFLKREMESD